MKRFLSFLMMAVFSASLFAATYTVAGSSAAAFGTSWDPTNNANDMTLVNGVYTLVKENVTLAASTLEYKVCKDHAWTTCYPSGDNAKLSIPAAGKYNLTFTFVESTGTVGATAQKTEDAQVDPKVSIKGAWDTWTDAKEFTLSSDKKSASLVMAVAKADTYEFKVIVGDGDWRSNEHVFTRDAASTTGMTGNSNTNLKLVADVAGDYTFAWTFATNALVVTFPEKGGDDPVTPPTPSGTDTIYFVNTNNWEAPYIYCWGGTAAGTTWPGLPLTEKHGKVNGYDIYMFITAAGAYANCIFSNNSQNQTEDLTWNSGKYFYDGKWYAYADIPTGGEQPIDPPTPDCQDGPYGLIFNGKDTVLAKAFDELDGQGRKQYQADSVTVKAGDKFVIANLSCTAKWVMAVEEYGAYADFEKGENEYTAKKDGLYTFFIKMSLEAGDVMYIGEITDSPEQPVEDGFYFVGTANNWTPTAAGKLEKNPENEAEYMFNTTLTAGDQFKVVYVENGANKDWYGVNPTEENPDGNYIVDANHAGEKTIYFNPAGNPEWGSCFYIAPNEGPAPTIADGFYFVGTANDWTPTAEGKFEKNPDNEAEYMLTTTLAAGDEFKVVYVENGLKKDDQWYPGGEGNNYIVDAAHAGEKTIYFRPDYQGGEDWHYGCIFVQSTGDGLEEIIATGKAAKILRNGQLYIIRGDKMYNVTGAVIR